MFFLMIILHSSGRYFNVVTLSTGFTFNKRQGKFQHQTKGILDQFILDIDEEVEISKENDYRNDILINTKD